MASKYQKNQQQSDDYSLYSKKREKMMKIMAWIAISGVLITTAITFGVAGIAGS